MTERGDRVPVDLDRLADHVSGALAGTPEADEVDRLVATDPGWAAAAEALRTADARVRADLAGLHTPAMPADVAARIEAALAGEAARTGAATAARDDARRGNACAPDLVPASRAGRGSVRPGDRDRARNTGASPSGPPTRTGDAPRRPGRARSRRVLAWAGAVVAFVALAGGVRLVTLGQQGVSNSASSATTASTPGDSAGARNAAPEAAGRAPAALPAGATASGTDYRPDTLARAARIEPAAVAPGGTVPPDLARLADPTALAACTSGLTDRYGGTVRSVDFARFQGAPALIVVLDGRPVRVVAAGARCGMAGTDELSMTTA
jgi:hypothetical protein